MQPRYTPQSGVTNSGSHPPKNWLVESILATLFCCLPFGIIAILQAASVNSKWSRGDYAGAQEASVNAAKWTKIALFTGLGVTILLIVGWFTFMRSFIEYFIGMIFSSAAQSQ